MKWVVCFFFSGEVLLWKRLKVQHAKNSAEGWTASSEQAVWSPSATTTASAHSLARKLLQSAIPDCCIDYFDITMNGFNELKSGFDAPAALGLSSRLPDVGIPVGVRGRLVVLKY